MSKNEMTQGLRFLLHFVYIFFVFIVERFSLHSSYFLYPFMGDNAICTKLFANIDKKFEISDPIMELGLPLEFFTNYTKMPIQYSLYCLKKNPVITCYP